jgi:hypothetical protein
MYVARQFADAKSMNEFTEHVKMDFANVEHSKWPKESCKKLLHGELI